MGRREVVSVHRSLGLGRKLLLGAVLAALSLALISSPATRVVGWGGVDVVGAAQAAVSKACKQAKQKQRRKCRGNKAGSAGCKKAKKSAKRACKKATPKPKIVGVYDDYYSPLLVRVKSGGSVRWVWNNMNLNAHNVTLDSGPRGVSKNYFSSAATGAINIKFERKFKVPGAYHFYCTIHDLMRMDVKVTR